MLAFYSHSDRPELGNHKWHSRTNWPEFIFHAEGPGDITNRLLENFSDFQLYLCTPDDELVGYSIAIPIQWDGQDENLPEGWTAALEQGLQENEVDSAPTTLCALGVDIRPDCQGRGYSTEALLAMRKTASRHKLRFLVAPVRPTLKSNYPLTPMENYIGWTKENDEPFDPWIRVHWRIGGRIARVAHKSMIFRGTVSEWEEWTGMTFPESGDYVVPGALGLITIEKEKNVGYHEEANVWIVHEV